MCLQSPEDMFEMLFNYIWFKKQKTNGTNEDVVA